MFNEVWGMAMSTILQCFCADEEIYKGDKDAMYAGSDLKATVSNSNKGKFAKKSKVAAAPAEQCQRAAEDDQPEGETHARRHVVAHREAGQ